MATAAQVAGVVKATHGGPPAGTTVAQWVAKAREENATFDASKVNSAGAVGWWQVKNIHSQTVKNYSGYAVPTDQLEFQTWLQSPLNNWLAAQAVYDAQGWGTPGGRGGWGASGGPPHVTDADRAAAAAPDFSIANSGGAVDGAPEAGVEQTSVGDVLRDAFGFALEVPEQLAKLAQILIDAGGWVSDRKNWGRIAMVVLGGAMALAAIGIVAKPIAKPAAAVVTKGKLP